MQQPGGALSGPADTLGIQSWNGESPQVPPILERVRSLIIEARDQPDLIQALAREFAGDRKVSVLLDGRRWERRQRFRAAAIDRRWVDRRRPPGPEQDILRRSYVIIRQESGTLE